MPTTVPQIVGAKTKADYENLANQCAIKIKELSFNKANVRAGAVFERGNNRVILGGCDKPLILCLSKTGTVLKDTYSAWGDTWADVADYMSRTEYPWNYLGQAKVTVGS